MAITATASSQYGTEPASNAVDGSPTTYWTTNGVVAAWLRLQLDVADVITQYSIRRRDDIPNRNPKDWTFEGSNDGTAWTTLDTKTGVTWATSGETKIYTFANSTSYLYYRINITANSGDASYTSIAEISLASSQISGTVVVASTVLGGFTPPSGGAASPADLTGKRLWLRAKDLPSSIPAASSWTDQSGLGNNGTSAGTLSLATASTPSGGVSARFPDAATGGYFTFPSTTMSGLTTAEAWVVIKSDAVSCGLWAWGSDGSMAHYPYGTTVYDTFGIAARISFAPTVAISSWRIYKITLTGGTIKHYLDETLQSTVTGLTNAWTTVPTIGAGHSGATTPDMRYQGNIAEVLFFDRLTTAGETADLITYFNTEHGLSVPGGSVSSGITGTVPATSGASGDITLNAALAGQVDAVSDVSGAFASGGSVYPISGQVDGVSGAEGTLAAMLPLAGQVDAVSGAQGGISITGAGESMSSGFGWGDALTSSTINLAPQTLSSGFGWGSALTTNTVTLQVMESGFGWGSRIEQPRDWGIPAGSTRPAPSVAIAHRDGTTVTVLDDVTIGALTKAVNVIDSWSFAVDRDNPRGKRVDPIALEAHLYRGDVLMSKGPIGPGRESNPDLPGMIQYDVSDPRRYLWDSESGRRIDRRPKLNWAYNGDFTLGTAGWTGGYEDGSIPAANPVFYVVDEPESSSGKGLRIEGVDKVVTAVSSVSSAAVFVPNSDTYLSGGAAKVIAAAASIPNGANISIVGHTANDGTGDGLHLSWLRALRAKGTLAGYNGTWTFSVLPGLRSPNETGSGVAGRGYYEPVATNSTEAGRTKNRRVDLHYATTQTAAGHMQYVVQRKYNVVNPVASKVPLEVTVAGRMRIGEWLGAPANGWAMRVSLLDSGFHIVGEVGTVTMSEATPRERLHDYSATIEVPADGQTYSLWYKLYPPAGWAVWSDIVVYPDEQLGFFDTDQALIVRDLVAFAQDATYGHGDLGIGTRTPLTGVTRIREYPFHEHKPVGTAIEEFTSLAYALDVDCETTPTTSTIVTHYPRQGSASGLTFAHGGERSIVKAYRRLPSGNLASSVVAQAWGIFSTRLERFASDPNALGGTLLETVIEADGESPLRELKDVAAKALARGIHPLAAWEVDLDPAQTTKILDRLGKGDTALLSLPDEGIHSLHRVVSMIWDPATDGLTLQMAPEEG